MLETRAEQEAKMIYRNLGKSGLKVSVIGFGNCYSGTDEEGIKTQTEIIKYAYS